jgi:hypothetical protein
MMPMVENMVSSGEVLFREKMRVAQDKIMACAKDLKFHLARMQEKIKEM